MDVSRTCRLPVSNHLGWSSLLPSGSLPVDLGQPWRASITAKGMRMEGVPRYSASTAGSMNVLLMESSYLGARSR